jgi:3-dehydroquinate synthase
MESMKTLWTSTLAYGKKTTLFLADNLKDLSSHLGEYGRNVIWVFDTNTSNMFKQMPPNNYVLESGEANKNMTYLLRIIQAASEDGMARDSRFIGFGGGVVCDMTSLASSLYMRGTALTLVPTTLLCMGDACLGGKTAVDFGGQKNLIGSFYPADEVLLCMDTLRTLPDKEFLSGMGEVIKHSVLSQDNELYKLLITKKREILARDTEVLASMVAESLKVKSWYLDQDPLESKGIRQMLNLGHTFGHALESLNHFGTLSHGQCVAWGTCRAFEAGTEMGVADKQYATGAIKLFKSYGYDIDYRIGRGDWMEYSGHLMMDKKKVGGQVQFVIPTGQGTCRLMPLDAAMVQRLVIAHY